MFDVVTPFKGVSFTIYFYQDIGMLNYLRQDTIKQGTSHPLFVQINFEQSLCAFTKVNPKLNFGEFKLYPPLFCRYQTTPTIC